MDYTFNLGKVHVPTPMGDILIENIVVDLKGVELKEVLMLMKELPQFVQAMKEVNKKEDTPTAGNPMSDILGEILKSKMSQGGSPFGAGFPFGTGEGMDVEEIDHPLYGKGLKVALDASKLGQSAGGDLSEFFKAMKQFGKDQE